MNIMLTIFHVESSEPSYALRDRDLTFDFVMEQVPAIGVSFYVSGLASS